jgi:hypothetical protein
LQPVRLHVQEAPLATRHPESPAPAPVTPEECPLMQSVLGAARQMFPGDPWEEVEPHLRRAWRSIREPTPWEGVEDWMHAAWTAPEGDPPSHRHVAGSRRPGA